MRRWILGWLMVWGAWLPVVGQAYFNERYPFFGQASGLLGVLATDSGYLATGIGYDAPGIPGQSLLLRFLDGQGRQRRLRHFGRVDYGYFGGGRFARLPDGSYAMTGSVIGPSGPAQAMLWRFTPQGDTLWTRSYVQAQSRTHWMARVCCTVDGGFAMVGGVSLGSNLQNVELLRTDAAGQLLWAQQYSGGTYNDVEHIEAAADGGFLLSGVCTIPGATPNTSHWDGLVIKVDSTGAVQWQQKFGTQGPSNSFSVAHTTRDGGYMVVSPEGQGYVNGNLQFRCALYKLDAQGNPVWRRLVGPTRNGVNIYAVHELADGSLVAAGQQGDTSTVRGVGNGYPEGFAFKVCADGDSLWFRSYKKLTDGRSHNYLRAFEPTPDGGFVGAGFLLDNATPRQTDDSWVFKTDQYGYLQAGGALPVVQCRSNGLPEEAADLELDVWPNPSADGRFTLRQVRPGATMLTVTDALGRVIFTAPFGPQTAPLELDLSRQPAGLYVLRVQWADGRTLVRRLVR